jgi:hypothetical protein
VHQLPARIHLTRERVQGMEHVRATLSSRHPHKEPVSVLGACHNARAPACVLAPLRQRALRHTTNAPVRGTSPPSPRP